MNPAEKYAALRVLAEAVAKAVEAAKEEADQYRRQTRAKSLETDWGTVSLTRREPTIEVHDGADLHQWLTEQGLSDLIVVTRSVSPAARKEIAKRLTVDGADIIDADTGELVNFASVSAPRETLTWRANDAARELAARYGDEVSALAAAASPKALP